MPIEIRETTVISGVFIFPTLHLTPKAQHFGSNYSPPYLTTSSRTSHICKGAATTVARHVLTEQLERLGSEIKHAGQPTEPRPRR